MRHGLRLLPVLLFALVSAFPQAQAAKPVSTPSVQAGNCSIAGVGYVSNVKIVCEDVPQKDVQRLLKTFNEILSDDKAINPKLDKIQSTLDEMRALNSHSDLGNLGQRAVSLALEIAQVLNDVDSELNNPFLRQNYSSEEIIKYHEQRKRITQNSFKHFYWKDIEELRQEFASHNYKSRRLDETVENIDSVPASMQLGPIWPEMETISACLVRLASQLPSPPPADQLNFLPLEASEMCPD
jgi:hypothetical protein